MYAAELTSVGLSVSVLSVDPIFEAIRQDLVNRLEPSDSDSAKTGVKKIHRLSNPAWA